MRLLWISAAPWNCTGYGNQTREMLNRLTADGHWVICGTKHNTGSMMEWEGHRIFQCTHIPIVNQFVEEENIDYVISLLDTWAIRQPYKRWIAYYPTDTQAISPMIIKSLEPTTAQIAMSKHGRRQLEIFNFTPFYAPHGIDTDIFRPELVWRKTCRKTMEWSDDTCVFGSVGANYPDDRKGFIPLLQAFTRLHHEHPNTALYLHTRITDEGNCVPLVTIANGLGIGHAVMFANTKLYLTESIKPAELAALYNGLDIHICPTHGEGFGLPIIESQACGVPTITTNTTSGPELLSGGWLINIDTDNVTGDDLEWSPMKTWRAAVRPSKVYEVMKLAYQAWEAGQLKAIGERAREGALEYDWDVVYPTYWQPILKRLDEMKDEVRAKEKEVAAMPKQKKIGFDGTPTLKDIRIDLDSSHV